MSDEKKTGDAIERFMEFINSGRHRREEMPADLKEDMGVWLEQRKVVYPDPMEPPWVRYPHIPFRSIGWRMGGGEDYWMAFLTWIRGLSDERFETYRSAHPEPAGWDGFYQLMRP